MRGEHTGSHAFELIVSPALCRHWRRSLLAFMSTITSRHSPPARRVNWCTGNASRYSFATINEYRAHSASAHRSCSAQCTCSCVCTTHLQIGIPTNADRLSLLSAEAIRRDDSCVRVQCVACIRHIQRAGLVIVAQCTMLSFDQRMTACCTYNGQCEHTHTSAQSCTRH